MQSLLWFAVTVFKPALIFITIWSVVTAILIMLFGGRNA